MSKHLRIEGGRLEAGVNLASAKPRLFKDYL